MKAKIAKVGEKFIQNIQRVKLAIAFLGEAAHASWEAICSPRKIRWKETLKCINMCGFDGLPIVIMICFLMGLVLGINAAIILSQWGTEIYMADMIGLSIVKELGPIMVAVIGTGRCGSAFAAEIGTMKINEEVDALSTMGLSPSRFLIIPKLIAMLFVTPFLAIFGNFAGIIGGFSVGYFQLDIPAVTYYNRTVQIINMTNFSEGIVKSIVFALLITLIGCMRGFEASNDAQSVGRATTSAVVTTTFAVIISDTLLTLVFNAFV